MAALLLEQYGFVRTLIPAKEDLVNSGLYVGTTKNCLLDGNWNEKFRVVIVVSFHCNTDNTMA